MAKKLEHLDQQKLKVGLVWAGRETHTNDKNRSISLAHLKQLASLQDSIEFISLQKGAKEDEDSLVDWKITKLGKEIESFSDSAAIIANLDLLISIDSAPIHLAGAMGAPVWSLIPFNFDFRWMVDQPSSPWYPSMKLFRQKEPRNWSPVIDDIERSLRDLIQTKPLTWGLETYDEHPLLVGTSVAGANFYLQSAFQYHLEGQLEKALRLYQKVREIDPNNKDAVRNLASLYRSLGNQEQAMAMYQYAIQNDFEDSILYSNFAVFLLELGKREEAMQQVVKALNIDGSNAAAQKLHLDLIGKSYESTSEKRQATLLGEPLPSNEQLILDVLSPLKELNTDLAKKNLLRFLALTNPTIEHVLLAAHVYQIAEELNNALECYTKAIALNPSHPEIYINRAVLKAKLGDYVGAIKDIRKCIELVPVYAEAHFHLSIYLLSMGEYAEGWKEYEWRMDPRRIAAEKVIKPKLSMPMWQGESLKNKRILLMPEQGFGDYIQFIRYAKWLKSLGAIVIAASYPALAPILEHCEWVDELVGEGSQAHYHFWSFPMSLPLRAGTTLETIPNGDSYLSASQEKIDQWQKWLYPETKAKNKPLIGICWEGSEKYKRNRYRNIPLEKLHGLLENQQFDFIGLTRESGSENMYHWKNGSLRNAGPHIKDFADTAGIIHHLDLLISIDSAPVHLAGAMGKPCWIMLDSVLTDFRWMLNRTDSPWYPKARLYRNKISGDWQETIKKLVSDLSAHKF